jgi:adenosylhomocysteine nucleosidase
VTRVLILTAIELEAGHLARHLGLDRVAGTPWPHFRGGVLELACVGVGGCRLGERAAAFQAPDVVVSAGTCGALAPGLAAGALVVPATVVGPAGARFETAVLPALPREGTLLTVREVVATAAAKARLWMETGALAVDMESAPVAEWAHRRGLPVAAVRGVSDTAAEAVPADMVAVVEPGGRVTTVRALRAVLARPRALADAMALRRGAERALRAVAAALARIARS